MFAHRRAYGDCRNFGWRVRLRGVLCKKSVAFSKAECAELAKDKAYEFVTDRSLPSILGVTSKDDFVVDDMDREFNYSGSDIKNSYYSWIVELEAYDFEIKIEVDTRNGNCKVIKVK